MLKRIDTDAISSQPEDRLRFLEDFVEFTDDDWTALRTSTEALVPRLPALVDALYRHLLGFDDTRRTFAVGDDVDLLHLAVRKQQLVGWVRATVSADPETRRELASYLNVIGRHTRAVPPRYVVGLVSFAQTSITRAIHEGMPDEPERALRCSMAWNKMLMMQLEMFLKNVAPQWPNWDEPQICTGEYPHDAPTARLS